MGDTYPTYDFMFVALTLLFVPQISCLWHPQTTQHLDFSTLRRDYEAAVVEKDRLVKLVEQLKNEKTHLVETVLQLSNEVDAAHKSSEQLEHDRQVYLQTDNMIRSARRRLGLQILGILESKGIVSEDPLMKVNHCLFHYPLSCFLLRHCASRDRRLFCCLRCQFYSDGVSFYSSPSSRLHSVSCVFNFFVSVF